MFEMIFPWPLLAARKRLVYSVAHDVTSVTANTHSSCNAHFIVRADPLGVDWHVVSWVLDFSEQEHPSFIQEGDGLRDFS